MTIPLARPGKGKSKSETKMKIYRETKLKTKITLLSGLLALFLVGSLSAQEAGTEEQASNREAHEVKIDGSIWTAYEFKGRDVNGQPDVAGSRSQQSGFGHGRIYVNLRGQQNEGPFSGISYRVTTDIGPAASLGSGCNNTGCQRDNSYTVFLKYAYLNIPIGTNATIRIGQQHTPTVDAQAGFSMQKTWNHRYIDADGKAPWDQTGLSSSSDRGIGFIFQNDVFGAHLLLANGEGYKRNNAERAFSVFERPDETIGRLSAGESDSYGHSLYGMLSYKPTGRNRENEFVVGIPFLFRNIAGVDKSETQFLSLDFCTSTRDVLPGELPDDPLTPDQICEQTLSSPAPQFFYGSRRAKQDYAYGLEAAYTRNEANRSITLGAGYTLLNDLRSPAFRIDQGILEGTEPSELRRFDFYYKNEPDRQGDLLYVYLHGKVTDWGGFIRLMQGTHSDRNLNTRLGSSSSQSWLEQILEIDRANNRLGTVSYSEVNEMDQGKGQFQTIVAGLTYHMSERFRISLGMSYLEGRDPSGRERRTNILETIPSAPGSNETVADQLESAEVYYANPQFFRSLGYLGPGQFRANDWIGRKEIIRQVFIRSEFKF